MQFAVISDIHGNLEALEKTLHLIDEQGIKEIVCLGDIVGYGANPNECIDIIREREIPCVLGNHDAAMIDFSVADYFSTNARTAAEWTRPHLTPSHFDFLASLPYTIELYNCTFVHSSPRNPQDWDYIMKMEEAHPQFDYFSTSLCWFGHTHVPLVFSENGPVEMVDRAHRYICNAGSVGQPRDKDWRLCFSLFDTEMYRLQRIRSDYDVEKTRGKILHAGLPRFLGDRLLVGI
jgi:predicted phosphodiesterase